jgi:hypothetical protein
MQKSKLALAGALVLCLVHAIAARASHPTDPNATLLDTIKVDVLVVAVGDGDFAATEEANVEHILIVWSTSNGVELVGSTSSTVATKSGSLIPDARDVFVAFAGSDESICMPGPKLLRCTRTVAKIPPRRNCDQDTIYFNVLNTCECIG